MTTGIDFNTEFIGMKPDEDSRSILELLEIERTSGYQGMTDDEISRLITYKEHNAERSKVVEDNRTSNEAMALNMKKAVDAQLRQSREFFKEILNMEPALVRVDGSEVE